MSISQKRSFCHGATMLNWFKNLNIKAKLISAFIFIFILSVVLITLSYSILTKKTFLDISENNLENLSNNIYSISENLINDSIKTQLKNTAEKLKQFIEYYYKQYKNGIISEEEALKKVKGIMLNPDYGKIGKIAIVSDENISVIHSTKEKMDPGDYEFLKQIVEMKNGYIEYTQKDKKTNIVSKNTGWLYFFEPWNLIIWVSPDNNDFSTLVNFGELEQNILPLKIGNKGYTCIIDLEGNILLHPKFKNKNFYTKQDEIGTFFVKDIINKKTGQIRYFWKNDENEEAKWIRAYFKYIENVNFIIIVNTYEDEIHKPASNYLFLLYLGFIILLLIISFFILIVFNRIIKPLLYLLKSVKAAEKENLSIKTEIYNNDEVGKLAQFFNSIINKYEKNSEEIKFQNKQIDKYEKQIDKYEKQIDKYTKEYEEKLDKMVRNKTELLANALIEMKKAKEGAIQTGEQLKNRNLELIDLSSQLIEINAKNDRLQDLIKQYTPKATWSHVLETLESETLDESLKEISVTMLFADIRNFTKFAEKFPPKEVLHALDKLFNVVSKVIYSNNGDIDKFVGDAFFAVFDKPYDCIRAVNQISKKVDEINDENMMNGKTPLYFRFGINTGSVVRGNIGSEIRRDNTLIGDAVNIAQRLESESIPGQILISKSTYDAVKNKVLVSQEIELTVKGKKLPIKAYYLEGIKSKTENKRNTNNQLEH